MMKNQNDGDQRGMDLKQRAMKLKKDVPAVFLALRKKETPFFAKICAAVTIIYALSPIDLIPDFIPVLGYLDDVILLPAMVALTVRLIPKKVLEQCRSESEGIWQKGKPKKLVYALPIAAVWLFILFLIARAIWC